MRNRSYLFMFALLLLPACGSLPERAPESSVLPQVCLEFVTAIGRAGSGPGQFLQPCGLAATRGEKPARLFVADTGNQRVQVLSADGDYQYQFGRFGVRDGEFNDPDGLDYDGGTVRVADRSNHRVQVFDWRGQFIRGFGGRGNEAGRFNRPAGLAGNGFGCVYVADAENDRVQRLDAAGGFLKAYGAFGTGAGMFRKPAAVAAETGGRFLVLDSGNGRMQRLNEEGDFLTVFGRPGGGEGELDGPQALAEADGLIFVADTGNNRVAVFSAQGRWVRNLAAPEMSGPAGITTDGAGGLYVADTGNNRILKYKYELKQP